MRKGYTVLGRGLEKSVSLRLLAAVQRSPFGNDRIKRILPKRRVTYILERPLLLLRVNIYIYIYDSERNTAGGRLIYNIRKIHCTAASAV